MRCYGNVRRMFFLMSEATRSADSCVVGAVRQNRYIVCVPGTGHVLEVWRARLD